MFLRPTTLIPENKDIILGIHTSKVRSVGDRTIYMHFLNTYAENRAMPSNFVSKLLQHIDYTINEKNFREICVLHYILGPDHRQAMKIKVKEDFKIPIEYDCMRPNFNWARAPEICEGSRAKQSFYLTMRALRERKNEIRNKLLERAILLDDNNHDAYYYWISMNYRDVEDKESLLNLLKIMINETENCSIKLIKLFREVMKKSDEETKAKFSKFYHTKKKEHFLSEERDKLLIPKRRAKLEYSKNCSD